MQNYKHIYVVLSPITIHIDEYKITKEKREHEKSVELFVRKSNRNK
jgi:hypothetical protein